MSIRSGFYAACLIVATAPFTLAQPPGMGAEDRELLDQFDSDKNGWLNSEERQQARIFIKENPLARRGFGGPPGGPGGFGGPGFGPPPGFDRPEEGRPEGDRPPRGFGDPGFGPPPGFDRPEGPRPGDGPEGDGPPRDFGRREGFGPPGDRGPGFGRGPGRGGRGGPGGPGRGGDRPPATQGIEIDKASVTPVQGDLYDVSVLRTIFLDFENADWEAELEDFHGTDIDVAATLTVDGKTYPNVGIHFRGASSYGMVQAGHKRSLNISTDMADEDQRLQGYKTLNLLNGSSDDSLMSTVLYSHIARKHIPAPKANFVRVVINGENWGIYTNVEQFNKDFIQANYGTTKGARWKVSGSPRGGGGLDYRGEDPANYQHPYEQKSGGKKSLKKLIELCRVLEETPASELPAALEPICNVDGLLWFLALDNGLINSDGYWVRASDYSIYLDKKDKFHFIPHDMNEAFRAAGGPGMGGRGPGGRGRGPEQNREARPDAAPPATATSPVGLDPLIGMDDPTKPLRSKVLAVPKYRQQYLNNIRELAETDLDWKSIEPFVNQTVELIDDEVKAGTRKLGTYEAFVEATSPPTTEAKAQEDRGGHGSMNLKTFFDQRREFLLNMETK